MRLCTWSLLAAVALAFTGCCMCDAPYDYCSPTFTGNCEGGPCMIDERAGSAFTGGGIAGVAPYEGETIIEGGVEGVPPRAAADGTMVEEPFMMSEGEVIAPGTPGMHPVRSRGGMPGPMMNGRQPGRMMQGPAPRSSVPMMHQSSQRNRPSTEYVTFGFMGGKSQRSSTRR